MTRVVTVLAAALAFAAASAAAARTDLTMGVVLEPPHLDPTAGAAGAIDEIVYANLFEGLTRIDRDGSVVPGLASSWTVSDDGLVYTFSLRPGVRFHDGTAFTAADVVFSLDRARGPGSVNAQKALFAPIAAVEAVDPLTVRITLARPTGSFAWSLGWGDAVMVAPESAATNRTRPVGTGPFRFHRWVVGDRVELVAADAYWGPRPALRRVVFKVIPDPTAAAAAVLAGDVDAFANIPAPESLALFEADPRFIVVVGNTEGETILALNHRRAPFDDLRVRRALGHAIDRRAVIDGAMFGHGTPIGSHFSPAHPAYVDLTDRTPYDPGIAKILLAEAGYPDGFAATLKLPPPSYARRGGEIVAAQLAEVGIEVEIIPFEWAQWLAQVFRGHDFDMTIVSHTEPMDIGIYARDDYYFGYRSDAFNAILSELSQTSDTAGRFRLLAAAQERLAEDAVNVFLFQFAKHGVWNARLTGLWHHAPLQANDVTGVSWR